MELPRNLQPLLDADVLRYEIAYAAETGWQTEGEIPPFEYVEKLLLSRIAQIKHACNTDKDPILFLSEGRCFRDKIAHTKPYKGTRKSDKPWHYNNLTVYFKDVMGAVMCKGIEADDELAIQHVSKADTILISRDKDLRQVPGWQYGWELGSQPSFGPELITKNGNIYLDEMGNLRGTGLAFFYAQVLMGDRVDNVPGCKGVGPEKAYRALASMGTRSMLEAVIGLYRKVYGNKWKQHLTEQGRLLWMSRRMSNGYPVMWKVGMDA